MLGLDSDDEDSGVSPAHAEALCRYKQDVEAWEKASGLYDDYKQQLEALVDSWLSSTDEAPSFEGSVTASRSKYLEWVAHRAVRAWLHGSKFPALKDVALSTLTVQARMTLTPNPLTSTT